MTRTRRRGLHTAAILISLVVSGGLAADDQREATTGPRNVAQRFARALAAGQLDEAARDCTDSYSPEVLRKLRSSIPVATLELNEVYADDAQALAITNPFPYGPAPAQSVQLSLLLRREGEIWLVRHAQIDEPFALEIVRRTFFQRHPGTRIAGRSAAPLAKWVARRFVEKFAAREFADAAALTPRRDEESLKAIRDGTTASRFNLAEFYCDQSRAVAFTGPVPLAAAPDVKVHYAVALKREGEQWLVHTIEIQDPERVQEVRSQFVAPPMR